MAHNGVFRVADERFDFQVLFDEAEKDFNLPAVFVDIGNGLGREPEMVGQKYQLLP